MPKEKRFMTWDTVFKDKEDEVLDPCFTESGSKADF